jgi:hypothetical protein
MSGNENGAGRKMPGPLDEIVRGRTVRSHHGSILETVRMKANAEYHYMIGHNLFLLRG